MLDRLSRMNRRRIAILRSAAVIVGFACTIHFAHRECAKSTDRPALISAAEPAPSGKASTAFRDPHAPEDFHATAYCVTGLTAAGVPVAPGYVSADPKVIPLGSMIYVESPLMGGIYQVMDTGAAVKGKIIDIFIPSYEACIEFGRRMVKVKVLRYGFKGNPPADRPAE